MSASLAMLAGSITYAERGLVPTHIIVNIRRQKFEDYNNRTAGCVVAEGCVPTISPQYIFDTCIVYCDTRPLRQEKGRAWR